MKNEINSKFAKIGLWIGFSIGVVFIITFYLTGAYKEFPILFLAPFALIIPSVVGILAGAFWRYLITKVIAFIIVMYIILVMFGDLLG